MRNFFGKLVLLSFIMMIGLTFAAIPVSAKIICKVAHVDPGDPFMSPDQAGAIVFKSMVETATNGEIEVQIFPASVLGKERESMEMLKNNLIQVYIATVGGMASVYPLIGILDLPFAIPNFSVAYEVFDGWFGDKLKKSIFDKTGIRCLEVTDQSGFFHFTNNKRLIRTPEDFKGIKFRTMALPSHIAFFKALGSSAIPISWAEVYTSLQTGVADGQHNPTVVILSGKLYEVQKYLTLTGHLWSTHWFLMNEGWFKSLTDEQKKIVTDAARTAKVAGRGITRIYESSEKGLPFLEKNMKVYQPSIKEKEGFASITIPTMKSFIKENLGEEGVALQRDFLKAIEDAKKKFGY